MMTFTLLWLSLPIALLDWLAVAKQWKPLELVAKPAVMVALLAWLWSVSGFRGPLVWFAAGLAFSLAGDIFLMLPREQFIPGLVSFLLAHVAYLIGFNPSPPPVNLASLLVLLVVGAATTRLYLRLAASLEARGEARLKTTVLAYSIVISLMLISALLTLVRPEWSAGAAWLAGSGALLFFISDSVLAWTKFVRPLPYGRLTVIVCYHVGQILIALAASLQALQ